MIYLITWLRRRNVVARVDPDIISLHNSNVTNPLMRGCIDPQQIDYKGWRGLDFSSCSHSLKSLSYVPPGIKVAIFSGCTLLEDMPSFVDGIEEIDFSGCLQLKHFSNSLPDGIKRLNLSNCPNLQINEDQVRRLGELNGIKVAIFSGCTLLEHMPNFVAGIEEIDFSGCLQLKHFPNSLPDGIKRLNLSNCPNLQISEDQARRLTELDGMGCEIQYPNQFVPYNEAGNAVTKLVNIGNIYKERNNIEAQNPIPSTKRLLERILTENIAQRGGGNEIIHVVNPVLEVLENNPNLLKSVEEIAALHLDGCINQPVAGWLEISALASIANAERITEKLEASKHLFVNDRVNDFVSREFRIAAVEVEAGNALLREVHKKALKNHDIKKPWLGVPGSIAYEGTISGWLAPNFFTRRGVVDRFYDEIKRPILHRDEFELANLLCAGNHCKTWGEIVFPDQVLEINQRHEQERSQRWDEIDEIPEDNSEKPAIIEEYNKYKTESEISQDQEVRRNVKDLTIEALNLERGISAQSILVDVAQGPGISVREGWSLCGRSSRVSVRG